MPADAKLLPRYPLHYDSGVRWQRVRAVMWPEHKGLRAERNKPGNQPYTQTIQVLRTLKRR